MNKLSCPVAIEPTPPITVESSITPLTNLESLELDVKISLMAVIKIKIKLRKINTSLSFDENSIT
ncbi:MAG: hypothetical protein RR620_10100 [Clostridium sp.]